MLSLGSVSAERNGTMSDPVRQIVAFGGGGFSMEPTNPLLDDYVAGSCRAAAPEVCFLPRQR